MWKIKFRSVEIELRLEIEESSLGDIMSQMLHVIRPQKIQLLVSLSSVYKSNKTSFNQLRYCVSSSFFYRLFDQLNTVSKKRFQFSNFLFTFSAGTFHTLRRELLAM
jgi:hypothetical protein